MSFEHWLAFVAASALLLAIPGPTILTVIGYSLNGGRRAGIPLVLAVTLGDSTALAVSLLGLGALLASSALWFTVIKVIGGAYLIVLGLKMLRAGGSALAVDESPIVRKSNWRLFANTYLVTALNPKGIVFFVAFLPQFIDPTHAASGQLWTLAITFVVLAASNAALYATFASAASRALSSPRAQRRFNLAGGTLLSIAGVWALLAKRPA